jgi:starvation-inducible DNA-binding protein
MNSVDQLLLDSLSLQLELNKLKKPFDSSSMFDSSEEEEGEEEEEEMEEEEEEEEMEMQVTNQRLPKNMIINAMRIILSSTFHMYYKAHAIHWNVEGINFPQYHEFFGDKYEEIHGAVDAIAEFIRILGEKAPATLSKLAVKQPNDNMNENDSLDGMIVSFNADNDRIIEIIRDAIKCAGACDEPAVQNFLQDRLDYHQKLSWMLRSIRK